MHKNNLIQIIRRIPPYFQLMRLHQTTGIWLLLFPCWWSVAMASPQPNPDIYLLGLFALGAIVMRGAGCVINDIIDRKIDAKVARTKNRPIASGAISVKQALWFLALLLVFGLIILLEFNMISIYLGFLFFIPVIIYPFMKRIIAWPQIFLGLTFNAGAIIGWSASVGQVDSPAIALYLGSIFWTVGYDTIYAHQDKKYDAEIGIKSTAISMKENSKIYITFFYLAAIIFYVIAASLYFTQHNLIIYSALLLALLHMIWQVKTVNLDDPKSCMTKFKSNKTLGAIIFAGIILEKMLN